MATSQGERGSSKSSPRKSSSSSSSSSPSSGGSGSSSGGGTSSALRDLAVSTVSNVSTDNILDLIEKLGVKDIVLNRVRARLEAIDVDSLIDDAIDYVRRRPEILVVTLGTITVAAALVVFLDRRYDDDEFEFEIDEDDFEELDIEPIKPRGGSGTTRSGGSSRSRSR